MKAQAAGILLWVALLSMPALADQARLDAKCPNCSTNLITVPVLFGYPSPAMFREVKLGHALLGGCVGGPTTQAMVCLKCRKWKTEQMKEWQDLPEMFGKDSTQSKERDIPNKSVEPAPRTN